MAEDYMEKIKKLLALSESSNEHEAKSALMKAKKLMAEHKISQTDLEGLENKKVKTVVTQFTCSKRKDPWMVELSAIIGLNFCCQAGQRRTKHKQTTTIFFVGFEDDLNVCITIYEYAVSCIRDHIRMIKKNAEGYDWQFKKKLCDGFGYGFARGIKEAFKQQKEKDETGWALVMVIPKEVTEATKSLKRNPFHCTAEEQMSEQAFHKGFSEGKKFDPSTKLTEKETEKTTALGGAVSGSC